MIYMVFIMLIQIKAVNRRINGRTLRCLSCSFHVDAQMERQPQICRRYLKARYSLKYLREMKNVVRIDPATRHQREPAGQL